MPLNTVFARTFGSDAEDKQLIAAATVTIMGETMEEESLNITVYSTIYSFNQAICWISLIR